MHRAESLQAESNMHRFALSARRTRAPLTRKAKYALCAPQACAATQRINFARVASASAFAQPAPVCHVRALVVYACKMFTPIAPSTFPPANTSADSLLMKANITLYQAEKATQEALVWADRTLSTMQARQRSAAAVIEHHPSKVLVFNSLFRSCLLRRAITQCLTSCC